MAGHLGHGGMLHRYVPYQSPNSSSTSVLIFLLSAVIIGCCPAFAVLANSSSRTKPTYDSQGYQKYTGSGPDKERGSKIMLRTIGSTTTRSTKDRNQHLGLETTDAHWAEAHSSQEQLRATHEGIIVSTTVVQK